MYETDEKCRKCKNNGTAICNRCDMYYDEFDPIDRPPETNADVRPVVRGRWIDDGGNKACSECRKIWLYRKTNFCPNCGAMMEES